MDETTLCVLILIVLALTLLVIAIFALEYKRAKSGHKSVLWEEVKDEPIRKKKR